MKNGGPIKKRRRGADDRRTWIDKVDKVFSLYIRLRDSRPWHFMKFRCISCGDVKDFDQMDAGHFVSRNAMAIRWNADNVSGECRRCNRLQGDHLLSYRKNLILKLGQKAIEGSAIAAAIPNDKRLVLIKKLGEKRVEELEAQKYVEKKWTVEELKELYLYYGALVLELKKSF